MGGRTKKVKSTGRFGARYGAGIRQRVLKVELRKKAKYICPNCRKKTLKWVAVGIWECKSCGFVWAGGAWDPLTDSGKKILDLIQQMKT